MILVLSTLPHFASIIPLYPHDMPEYKTAIIVSSTISVIWHAYGQPANTLLVMDYVAACYWAFYEIHLSHVDDTLKIYALNVFVLLLNAIAHGSNDYVLYHSLWHILSALKCFYVATLISRRHPFKTLRRVEFPYPSGSYPLQALNTRSPSSRRSSSFPP